MEGIQEVFEIVFGKEFVNEMATRLIIIVCSLVAILLVVLIISAWKAIACKKSGKQFLHYQNIPIMNMRSCASKV